MPNLPALIARARRPDAKLDGWFWRRAAVFEAITGVLLLVGYLARSGDAETRHALAENLPPLIKWIVAVYLVGGTAHQVLMSKLKDADPPPSQPEHRDVQLPQ